MFQSQAVRYEDKRVQNQPIVDTSYRQSIIAIISVFYSSDESASVRGENTVIYDRPYLDKYCGTSVVVPRINSRDNA
jgi:hypothetical protein